MGLDMFLESVPKVEGVDPYTLVTLDLYEFDKEKNQDLYKKIEPHIYLKGKHITWLAISVTEGKWNKAHSINGWFVEMIQDGENDCDYYEVSREDITELLSLCKTVMKYEDGKREDAFYGYSCGWSDTRKIDIETLEETINICQRILRKFDFKNRTLFYTNSW